MEKTAELKIVNKFFKEIFPFVIEVSDASPSYNISPHRLRLHNLERPQEFELLEIGMYITPTHFCELMDPRIESEVISRMRLTTSTFLKSVFTDWKGSELRLLFFPDINEQTILKELPNADS